MVWNLLSQVNIQKMDGLFVLEVALFPIEWVKGEQESLWYRNIFTEKLRILFINTLKYWSLSMLWTISLFFLITLWEYIIYIQYDSLVF